MLILSKGACLIASFKPYLSPLSNPMFKSQKFCCDACKCSRNVGINVLDWAKGPSKQGPWGRHKPVPDVSYKASATDIFHTSVLPRSHQFPGWSHSSPCCVSHSRSLPACSSRGRAVEGSQQSRSVLIPALIRTLQSARDRFLEQRLFPCLRDIFRQAKKYFELHGKSASSDSFGKLVAHENVF